ncbi:ribonuclease H-like domain-containing protein, partial [Tanacetum coccineum]
MVILLIFLLFLSLPLLHPNWQNAMYDEYNALIKNSTWVLVSKPSNVNVVRSMWLFRHKYHADGSLSRYKARLVANGHSQQFGVDCDDTFSPVVKPATVRMPPGFVDARFPHHVCRLQRSLYGLKQAPRAWFQRFAGYTNRVGFSSSRSDSSLFIYQHGFEVAYLLIYVDDIVLTISSTDLLQRIISSLHKEFDMADLGALNYFLGISVTRDSTGMFMSQKKYALVLLDRAHMANCNPTRTPMYRTSSMAIRHYCFRGSCISIILVLKNYLYTTTIALFPGDMSGDNFPQRHVAGESPDMSPGKRAIV